MNKILCHIVGINSSLKGKLINFLTSKKINLNVIDLDLITDKINESSQINKKQQEIDDIEDKVKNSGSSKKIKELEKDMSNIWKDEFEKMFNEELNKFKEKVIVIGLSTYFKNQRINVKIDSKLKFFVKVNLNSHAKNIIENNLNNYRDEIINGIFPLSLLNLEHLVQKRENLINIYKKLGYTLRSLNSIIEVIASNFNFDMSKINEIYFASNKKFVKKVDINEVKGSGYTIPWLAIVSSLDNKNITKGFKKTKPFIKINQHGSSKLLDTDCYLYKVCPSNFYHNKNGRGVKFTANNSFKINESYYIDDIHKYLKDNDIDIL